MTLRETVRKALEDQGVIHPGDSTVTCWRTGECDYHGTCTGSHERPSDDIVTVLVVAMCNHVTELLKEESGNLEGE